MFTGVLDRYFSEVQTLTSVCISGHSLVLTSRFVSLLILKTEVPHLDYSCFSGNSSEEEEPGEDQILCRSHTCWPSMPVILGVGQSEQGSRRSASGPSSHQRA